MCWTGERTWSLCQLDCMNIGIVVIVYWQHKVEGKLNNVEKIHKSCHGCNWYLILEKKFNKVWGQRGRKWCAWSVTTQAAAAAAAHQDPIFSSMLHHRTFWPSIEHTCHFHFPSPISIALATTSSNSKPLAVLCPLYCFHKTSYSDCALVSEPYQPWNEANSSIRLSWQHLPGPNASCPASEVPSLNLRWHSFVSVLSKTCKTL